MPYIVVPAWDDLRRNLMDVILRFLLQRELARVCLCQAAREIATQTGIVLGSQSRCADVR